MILFERRCAVGQSWPRFVAINNKLVGGGNGVRSLIVVLDWRGHALPSSIALA